MACPKTLVYGVRSINRATPYEGYPNSLCLWWKRHSVTQGDSPPRAKVQVGRAGFGRGLLWQKLSGRTCRTPRQLPGAKCSGKVNFNAKCGVDGTTKTATEKFAHGGFPRSKHTEVSKIDYRWSCATSTPHIILLTMHFVMILLVDTMDAVSL